MVFCNVVIIVTALNLSILPTLNLKLHIITYITVVQHFMQSRTKSLCDIKKIKIDIITGNYVKVYRIN